MRDYARARVDGGDFRDAELAGADFFAASAVRADFSRADLSGATLSAGNFAGARFILADLSAATALSLAPAAAAIVGAVLLVAGGTLRTIGLVLVLAYATALLLSGLHAAVRFRSVAVGALEPPAVMVSQAAYLVGFVRGLTRRRR